MRRAPARSELDDLSFAPPRQGCPGRAGPSVLGGAEHHGWQQFWARAGLVRVRPLTVSSVKRRGPPRGCNDRGARPFSGPTQVSGHSAAPLNAGCLIYSGVRPCRKKLLHKGGLAPNGLPSLDAY